ncbi:hypothetical protein FRB99_005826 [Tulasnella sp. 403]|nr:hypothetical protein FRB99_005826 [Tulasnella sp. 403]
MDPSNESQTKAVEQELATALDSLKPFLLKRSWISIPKKDSEIGVGGFGTVHRADLRRGLFGLKTPVAVKKLYAKGERGTRLRVALELVRELTIHASLNHPNILPLVGFYLSTKLDEAWLVSPYAPNGNIYDYLECINPTLDKRLEMAKDTAKGLEYLHTRTPPICHGDIKALNVLVAGNMIAMLCDFGLSKSTEGMSTTSTTKNAGTSRYWSPELLQPNNRPTLESDVWAWGCLLLEITENILPAPLDTLDCPNHVRDLLAQCWQIPPSERPKMSELVTLITAGNLHFLTQGSVSTSVARPEAQLGTLERELAEFLAPLEKYRIKPSRLLFPRERSVVGTGGFGTVHQALLRNRFWGNFGIVVAVKKLRAAGGPDKCLRMAIALIRELAVWAVLSHDNIIPLVGFYLSERLDQAWLVSPYIQNGNINDYLMNVRPDEQKRRELALDTAKGLQYLHSRDPPICHGDIKALNVLITDEHRAMLCDFGLAKTMETMPSGLTTSTFNQGGSLPYESPELLLGRSTRSPQSDVWAWGCLLQEIFTGKPPYYWAINIGAIVKWIVQDIPPASIADLDCPASIRTLLTYCWRPRPAFRPTMTQCIHVLSNASISTDATVQELEAPGDRVPERARILMRSNLTFEDLSIGSGSLGMVFRANLVVETTGTDTVVAIKRLFQPKDPGNTDSFLSLVQSKANRWSTLLHPNVLSVTGYCQTQEDAYVDVLLVFPWMPSGTITDYIKQSPPDHSRRMKFAADIAQGLFFLQSRTPPIRHGNLHPGNVLVNANGDAVLCDYDTDELVDQVEEHTVVHSFRYLSPEQFLDRTKLSLRSDIWCLGSTFLYVVTGQVPYRDITDQPALVEILGQRVMPVDIDELDCPPRAQNVIGLCLKWEPESRSSLSEIISILSGKLCKLTEAWSTSAKEFSYDGKFLAVGFLNFGFKVYDAETGALAYELPLSGPAYRWVQISRSGRFLTASNCDHNVFLWDIETRELKNTFEEHKNDIWALDMPSNDSYVMSASYDNTIRIWRLALAKDDGKLLKRTKEHPSCLVISPVANVAALSMYDHRNELIDAHSGETIAVLERPEHTWTLRFPPDGKRVYGGCVGGRVCYWDVGDLVPNKGKIPVKVPSRPYHEIKGAKATVSSVSASNSWLASISDDGDLRAMKFGPRVASTESIGKIGRIRDSTFLVLG